MPFRPSREPAEMPAPAELTARMVAIGLGFAARPAPDADIEETLVFASIAGMVDDDLRVLSVLTTWLGVHHAHVNADRLVRRVRGQAAPRVRAYWAAIAHWQRHDRRLARLRALHRGDPVELLSTGTAFQISRRGEDPRFAGTPLRVPHGTLRDRAADVLAPDVLVRRHAGYRNRVLMGPTFRADVWTVLEQHPDLPVAEIARRAACAFATAWQVVQDFRLLRAASWRGFLAERTPPVRPDLDPSPAAVVRADRDRSRSA